MHELSEVVDVRPLPDGGYEVDARTPGRRGAPQRSFTAGQVVLAASARGTQLLLHRLRVGSLPRLSARVGELSRSNSEAIVSVVAPTPRDFDRGIAITSSFHPEPHTHVELCHSSESQDAMALMNVPLVDGGPRRVRRFLAEQVRHPVRFVRSRSTRASSKRTVSLLVMQSLDNSLTSYVRRGRLRTRQGSGTPNPAWIPLAHEIARRYAARIGGAATSLATDLVGKPATAHYIGGAVIGDTAASGVVDPYHRVFGYDGLHVIDGATIGANLGANPSLTITAMAERAAALWPNHGEPDPRPAVGADYVPVAPVAPHSPTVSASASGALRLTRC